MRVYSYVSEQDLDNLRKLAEQQKKERALKIKNRILKQTHDVKLAESLSPITEKLDEVGEIIKKSQPSQNIKTILENSESQTPAIDNISSSQSLRDTLSFMKKSKSFFKLIQDGKDVFWHKTPIKPQGENKVSIRGIEFDINPNIQDYFTNTNQTTKNMDDEDKLTIYNILNNVGFYSMRHTKGLKSARFNDAKYILPNEINKTRNPSLPTIENEINILEGDGVQKIIIPSNIIDFYTRLEVLLGLKLSGHTDTLTEASNLIDELYKLGEIQTKQQYRNALDKFTSK